MEMEEKMSGALSGEAMEKISERLSSLENLYFPRALQSNATDPSQRKSIFLDLLSRDTALFLERYGSQLTCNELSEFDVLNDDYEISWHLKHLRSIMSPTSEDLKTRSVTVKNRRRAYLDKLISDGKYFSEDAMRDREPYLHHEYVGKFQEPSGRGMARPGERWSETLLRRSEEAILVAKIRGEQQRLGVAERDWIGDDRSQAEQEEEEEEGGGRRRRE
ncbi:coiled-coil domain-containing protein 97 [Quillaja saponaria]|uniref:Coiled-coil domain-containing protein 97 n=1 Tax=Quillaja saponaria TaxID=32244 RepID=A0AAD7KRY3_QUISA|nr:coiled-coil domain-containing protein 97 [Quillaja saponaria]